MSRHRHIRSAAFQQNREDIHDYSDDDYDDETNDRDAARYMYDRSNPNNPPAYDDYSDEEVPAVDAMASLSDENRAILMSVIDQIRDVLGDKLPQHQLTTIVLGNEYDVSKSMEAALLALERTPSPAPAPPPPKPTAAAAANGLTKNKNGKLAQPKKKNKAKKTASNSAEANTEAAKLGDTYDGGDTVANGEAVAGPSNAAAAVERPIKVPAISKAQATRNARAMYDEQRGEVKAMLHMVVVGHVDAGKSTLMGHTLHDLGKVSQQAMHKYTRDSRSAGKASFKYAWVLDETGEERERGITMDVGSVRFDTKTKIVTLLDAPGHKDFIPNMIAGTTQADVALLVVDATVGEFETGFEHGGQTREHVILVRSLGVSQLGVVVNKLDTVGWSQQRFAEIVDTLKPFLQQVGFKAANVRFLPASGLTGENLVKAPSEEALTKWYSGPTLETVIDTFTVPPRSIDHPFRMTVSDIFQATGTGVCLAGRIETGVLAAGDQIYVCPLKEPATVKSVMIDDFRWPACFAGDHVTVTLSGVDMQSVTTGAILCDIQRPVPIVTRFQVRLVVFQLRVPLTAGSPVLLHHHALVEPASVGRLKALLNKQTGVVEKKNPRCLVSGACALVVLQTCRPICLETFADCKELGRVTLRIGGETVAAGVVTKVLS